MHRIRKRGVEFPHDRNGHRNSRRLNASLKKPAGTIGEINPFPRFYPQDGNQMMSLFSLKSAESLLEFGEAGCVSRHRLAPYQSGKKGASVRIYRHSPENFGFSDRLFSGAPIKPVLGSPALVWAYFPGHRLYGPSALS